MHYEFKHIKEYDSGISTTGGDRPAGWHGDKPLTQGLYRKDNSGYVNKLCPFRRGNMNCECQSKCKLYDPERKACMMRALPYTGKVNVDNMICPFGSKCTTGCAVFRDGTCGIAAAVHTVGLMMLRDRAMEETPE